MQGFVMYLGNDSAPPPPNSKSGLSISIEKTWKNIVMSSSDISKRDLEEKQPAPAPVPLRQKGNPTSQKHPLEGPSTAHMPQHPSTTLLQPQSFVLMTPFHLSAIAGTPYGKH